MIGYAIMMTAFALVTARKTATLGWAEAFYTVVLVGAVGVAVYSFIAPPALDLLKASYKEGV